jgi:hypothetical protein
MTPGSGKWHLGVNRNASMRECGNGSLGRGLDEHPSAASRAEDAQDLRGSARWIGKQRQSQTAHDGDEFAVSERQGLSVEFLDPDVRLLGKPLLHYSTPASIERERSTAVTWPETPTASAIALGSQAAPCRDIEDPLSGIQPRGAKQGIGKVACHSAE